VFRPIINYTRKALNVGRRRSRRSHAPPPRMDSYNGPYSPVKGYEQQHSVPTTKRKGQGLDPYLSAGAQFNPGPNHAPREYDPFEPAQTERPLRVPNTPVREHKVAMMHERLMELHQALADMGCTPDTQPEDVPEFLREDLEQILGERKRIARGLGRLCEDITEVESAIEAQKTLHSLDDEAFLPHEDGGGEIESGGNAGAVGELDWDYNAGEIMQRESYESANTLSPASFPDAEPGRTESEEENAGMASVQHQEADPYGVHQTEMHENPDMWGGFAPESPQDAQQLQQQQLEQQQRELERREEQQPGPLDLPGGLEDML